MKPQLELIYLIAAIVLVGTVIYIDYDYNSIVERCENLRYDGAVRTNAGIVCYKNGEFNTGTGDYDREYYPLDRQVTKSIDLKVAESYDSRGTK